MAGKLQNSITIGNKKFDGTSSVSITKSDLGLDKVNNTADKDKVVKQASNDGAGQNIVNTYIKKGEINSFSSSVSRNMLLYTSKIDDGFASCDQFAKVEIGEEFTNNGSPHVLFDGNYETSCSLKKGTSGMITIDFSETYGEKKYPEYPYGYFLFFFYDVNIPESISVRVYNTFQSQGIGWQDLTVENVERSLYRCRNNYYGLQKIEITIEAKSDVNCGLAAIEFYRTRQSLAQPQSILTKYKAETLYYQLTAPSFKGDLVGNADSSSSIKWTEY